MTSDMAGWCRLPWGVAVAVGRVSASVWRRCMGGSMTSDMAGWCRLPCGVAVAVGRVSASVWRSCGGGSGVGIRVAQLCGRAYDE